jgi:pyruvate/2-oxoglutarate dehydrogenase complex dihydrolipoamide acyltransferase (E2) component
VKIILTIYADVSGQHYGPGTRLVISDELGQALIQQGKAKMIKAAPELVVDATETARILAEQHGIDLATVSGSGSGGRIIKSDIDKILDG